MIKLIPKFMHGTASDGIYVDFPDYQVTVPNSDQHIPGGHALAVAVDENSGTTRGSEYGRYNSNYGSAHRVIVPDFHPAIAGEPTEEELEAYSKKILDSYSKGREDKVGNTIRVTYVKGPKYDQIVKAMSTAEKSGINTGYSWLRGITCGSYANRLSQGKSPSEAVHGAPTNGIIGFLWGSTRPSGDVKASYSR